MMPSPGLIIAEFDGLDQDLNRSLSSFDIPHRETRSAFTLIHLSHLKMEGNLAGWAPVHALYSMSSPAKSLQYP